MVTKAVGGNMRPRATLLFSVGGTDEKALYKNLTSDLSEQMQISPTNVVLSVLVDHVCSTREGRDIARELYSSQHPACAEAYALAFDRAGLVKGTPKADDELISSFMNLCSRYQLRLAPGKSTRTRVLIDWGQFCGELEHAARESGDVDALTSASMADTMASVLADENGESQLAIAPYVHLIQAKLGLFHDRLAPFTALSTLARSAHSITRGIEEGADDRLRTVSNIDKYFSAIRPADPQQ